MLNGLHFSEIFLDEDGNLKEEGDLLINTKLGCTLEKIAEDPPEFYDDQLAQDIADDIAEYGKHHFLGQIQTALTP